MNKWNALNLPYNCVVAECSSTNELAKSLARAGAPHGTWISSLTQTQGRGRLGRSWISLPGNLFLSFVLRFPLNAHSRERLGWVPLLAGKAVLDCMRLRQVPSKLSLSHGHDLAEEASLKLIDEQRLFIKWPNDIVLKSKDDLPSSSGLDFEKVGGILCEGALGSAPGPTGGPPDYSPGSFEIVCGIGLNLAGAPIDRVPSSNWLRLKREQLLDDIIEKLPNLILDELNFIDTEVLISDFFSRSWKKRGDKIGFTRNTKNFQADLVGLSSRGELEVMRGNQIEVLSAEEISLAQLIGRTKT